MRRTKESVPQFLLLLLVHLNSKHNCMSGGERKRGREEERERGREGERKREEGEREWIEW